jgi:hypothetical protein
LCIQETKKEDFSQHFLLSISSHFSEWQFILSVGVAGGILLGINTNCCQLLNWHLDSYSLIAYVQNKKDQIIWACTTVYGPTSPSLKTTFWAELYSICSN